MNWKVYGTFLSVTDYFRPHFLYACSIETFLHPPIGQLSRTVPSSFLLWTLTLIRIRRRLTQLRCRRLFHLRSVLIALPCNGVAATRSVFCKCVITHPGRHTNMHFMYDAILNVCKNIYWPTATTKGNTFKFSLKPTRRSFYPFDAWKYNSNGVSINFQCFDFE